MKTFFLLCFILSTNHLGLALIYFEGYYYPKGSSNSGYSLFDIVSQRHQPDESGVIYRLLLAGSTRPDQLSRKKAGLQYTFDNDDKDQLGNLYSTKTIFKTCVINSNGNVTLRKDKGDDEPFYLGINQYKENIKKPFTKNIQITKQNNQEIITERSNASDVPQELRVVLLNRCRFLLLNSTIEEPTTLKTNLSEVYESLRNSDVTKVIVKLLKEKLKRLNEQEKLTIDNSSDKSLTMTQSPFRLSKWDIVREFFLKKEKPTNNLPNPNKNTNDVKLKDSFSDGKKDKHILIKKLTDSSGRTDSTQEFSSMVDNFYNDNVLKFVSENNENTKYSNNYDNTIDDESLEFFNINLPYNVEQNINSENSFINHDYTTEKTEEENAGRKFEEDTLTLKLPSIENKPSKYSGSSSNTNHTTTKYEKKTFVSVPTKNSKSEKLSVKLSNLFVWHKKKDGLKEETPPILNENFLLTLNSKNQSKKHFSEIPEMHTTDKIPTLPEEYYSISYPLSFESASSESEDLYNNSIVFVMHKRNKTGLKKDGKWNSLLNFFHIARGIPCPRGKNPCIDSSNRMCTFNYQNNNENTESSLLMRIETVTESFETTTPKIILLPESLMPEALEGRQLNETDLMFYDDPSLKDEHNSTGSFFFFFK